MTTSCRRIATCFAVKPSKQSHTVPSTKPSSNPVIQCIVSAATETLRLIAPDSVTSARNKIPEGASLSEGDVDTLVELLKADFEKSYFVTGKLCDSIYTEDCSFSDPTIQFSGRELWKRNVSLLTPFLVDPRIELKYVEVFAERKPVVLKAQWRLITEIRLPWKPCVDIDGSTLYTLNSSSNAICSHAESWSITGLEALVLIFTPSQKQTSTDE